MSGDSRSATPPARPGPGPASPRAGDEDLPTPPFPSQSAPAAAGRRIPRATPGPAPVARVDAASSDTPIRFASSRATARSAGSYAVRHVGEARADLVGVRTDEGIGDEKAEVILDHPEPGGTLEAAERAHAPHHTSVCAPSSRATRSGTTGVALAVHDGDRTSARRPTTSSRARNRPRRGAPPPRDLPRARRRRVERERDARDERRRAP
jgi:hypothetical protein